MFKIVALNDLSKKEDDQQDETITQVSKEAQETIAISEYLRALELKVKGKTDFALSLFEDLLRTQVLSDVPNDDRKNKLFSVKCSCYRNIGLIYEERQEHKLALQNLVEAVNLDDSDVVTQFKIGKLALKLNDLILSKTAFENCLERNPNHWGAKDGYLETLCLMEAIDQAYGFAFKCYKEDRKYTRAIRVLKEIRERMRGSLEFYDGIYGHAPEFDADCKIEFDPENSVFPPYKEIGFIQEKYAVIPDELKLAENENLSWISFGKLILQVYDIIIENKCTIVTFFKWSDWVGKIESLKEESLVEFQINDDPTANEKIEAENVPKNENEQESDVNVTLPSAEDADNENQDSKKSSNRRRCSDLDFLKEWGWHKNRRSSRKKPKEDEEVVDTTINGYLRRILANYFATTFDSNHSPFEPDTILDENKSLEGDMLDTSKSDAENEEKFNEFTRESFNNFIASFKDMEFDLYIPMFHWIKHISSYWNKVVIPSEVIELYKKIYFIYEGYIDYHNLYHMQKDNFIFCFRAALFQFELVYDEFEETKVDIPDEYIRMKDFLQINLAFVDDEMERIEFLIRLYWLSYGIQIHYNNYKDALGYLYKIEEIYEDEKYREINIELKNCKHHKLIDIKTVKDLVVKIERKINLASVKKLYDTQNYEELVNILLESIIYSTGPKVNIDSLTLKIQMQISVLLECLFSLNRIEECLCYSEKSLYYAVKNFLTAPTEYRLEEWAGLVNFCLVYIEAIIKEEGSEMLFSLNDKLPRLVQSLTQIISNQLDSPTDKNNLKPHLINVVIPWIILYPLVLREDDIANAMSGKKKQGEDNTETEDFGILPNSLLMLFTAHEFLGRKQWCMKDNGKLWIFLLDNLASVYRTPLLEPFRDIIFENLEQTTYCLYGFPAKKSRFRHIEDHDAKNIDLTWERAIQLYDLYRPETLPEFDSYKLQSISSEMEQLLQRILLLIPKCLDIQPFISEIKNFINGTVSTLPKEINILPSKISSIYYLLADFYFKNQETGKAVKYYICDLTMKPDRFDSWASLSLCKQSKLEMRLNSFNIFDVKNYLELADQAINCFNQCLKLKKTTTILTEFASFTYHLHSFCSRNLKQSSETLSMESFEAIEKRKEKFLNISFNCFSEASQMLLKETTSSTKNQDESDENHDEKWFYFFMLGKIAEKRKEMPLIYLNHYLKSAKYLYEDNATYPIKINHNNPTHLSLESLEVYYRISACIMKYLEQHEKINKSTAKLFHRVLKEVSTSAFAYNRAKINEDNINALKRKLNTSTSDNSSKQVAKAAKIEEANGDKKTEENATSTENLEVLSLPTPSMPIEKSENMEVDEVQATIHSEPQIVEEQPLEPPIQPIIKTVMEHEMASRRGSQESAITSTTTTSSATRSSSTSSDSSSDSSDSDSSSDDENVFIDQEQIRNIFKMCVKNLEECVSRFPEHYKTIFRLVHHFLNEKDGVEKSRQLLLTTEYKTGLGNSIQGLFSERKNNNFFNGVWRIPSQEIDRPGNFTAHLTKCISVLMDVLKKTNDYETLLDLALQLQRNPEAEKKYLNDDDRKDLFQQAVTCCVQALRNKQRDIMSGICDGKNSDRDLLGLMLDIFKAHRKTLKIFQQKEQSLFSAVLVEVYKEYIKDKMILPENANFTDLAFKMCQQEINYRKNLEKGIITPNPHPAVPVLPVQQPQTQVSSPAPIQIKSVSEINKSVIGPSSTSANTPTGQTASPQSNKQQQQPSASSNSSARTKPRTSSSNKNAAQLSSIYEQMMMTLYANPSLYSPSFISEYYKALGIASSGLTPQQLALLNDTALAGTSTNTKPTTSSYEAKFLESLMTSTLGASPLQGLQQNLLSNSLSITTTTITSTTSTSSPRNSGNTNVSSSASKAQPSASKKSGNDGKESMRKSLPSSKASDSSSKFNFLGANLNLPDLPKSLSITPTIPGSSGSSSQKSSSATVKKLIKEAKANSMSSLGKYNLNPGLSITKESVSSNNKMLSSYQEFLKNYSAAQTIGAMNKKSSPVTITGHGLGGLHKSKSVPQQSTSSGGSSAKKSSSSTKIPYDFGKNIASSFSTLPMPSPTLSSSSPFSQHTPPLTPSPRGTVVVSPPKTLQQKLAERKQQNQQQKSSSASKKPDNDDVIILD